MIRLLPREPPLEPAAVVASGDALQALSRATARQIAGGCELRAAGGEGWLLVLGAQDELPWADGCRYLGWDGPLLVPTTTRPSLPAELVADAVADGNPLVVLLEDAVLRGPQPLRVADTDLLP